MINNIVTVTSGLVLAAVVLLIIWKNRTRCPRCGGDNIIRIGEDNSFDDGRRVYYNCRNCTQVFEDFTDWLDLH